MILMASFLSLTSPMCQPPRHSIDTLTPVLPSGRVGSPFDGVSSAPAPAVSPRAAPAAAVAPRKSRRLLPSEVSSFACGCSFMVYLCSSG